VWADGIDPRSRLEDARQCVLVIIGATPEGGRELLGVTDGARKRAGLARAAARFAEPGSGGRARTRRRQACPRESGGRARLLEGARRTVADHARERRRAHKSANILDKPPKSRQPKTRRSLREIRMAETSTEAGAAFDAFIAAYQPKYDKAAECLAKHRQALLAFHDLSAEHGKHPPTANPIESTFAAIRHRAIRAKGCLSNRTALAMVFKLVAAARKSGRRLDGHNQLPKLIQGVRFTDGIEVAPAPASSQSQTAAARTLRPSPKSSNSSARGIG
jgi:putative transposase